MIPSTKESIETAVLAQADLRQKSMTYNYKTFPESALSCADLRQLLEARVLKDAEHIALAWADHYTVIDSSAKSSLKTLAATVRRLTGGNHE